jgi:hypothetical protein
MFLERSVEFVLRASSVESIREGSRLSARACLASSESRASLSFLAVRTRIPRGPAFGYRERRLGEVRGNRDAERNPKSPGGVRDVRKGGEDDTLNFESERCGFRLLSRERIGHGHID